MRARRSGLGGLGPRTAAAQRSAYPTLACSISSSSWRRAGLSCPNRELLDARALVGHLVPAGSMFAFLSEYSASAFSSDDLFADLFTSTVAAWPGLNRICTYRAASPRRSATLPLRP